MLRHCCGSCPIRGPNICVPSQQVDEGQQNGDSGVQNIELLFSNDAISRAWRISSTCGDYAKPSGFAISQRGTGADAEKWCAAGGHFLRRIPIPMWIRHRESQISRIHPELLPARTMQCASTPFRRDLALGYWVGGPNLSHVQLGGAGLWLKYDVLALVESNNPPLARFLLAKKAGAHLSYTEIRDRPSRISERAQQRAKANCDKREFHVAPFTVT